MAPDDATPRPVASFDQAGDTSIGQAVGGNVVGGNVVHGMDPAQALTFVRDYIWRMDQQREQRDRELADAVAYLSDQFKAYQIMDSRRQSADDKERETRREALDRTLDAIAGALDDQADALVELRRGQRHTRFWLVTLTAALAGAVIIVAALVQRELAALALRAVFDVSLALRR